jgi:hypothetical protein
MGRAARMKSKTKKIIAGALASTKLKWKLK